MTMENNFYDFNTLPEHMDFLTPGETYHVISDVVRLTRGALRAKQRFNPDEFITALQKKVGPQGTLLFPTFNYDFCHGDVFDVNETPGLVGVLGNAARVRNDFIRTSNPIHSFAVWGAKQDFFAAKDYRNSFGPDSIFEDLLEMDARTLIIDKENTMAGMTMMHHAEQVAGVPYRYNKHFTSTYRDSKGVESTRTYDMYVRDLDMDPKDHSEMLSAVLDEKGLAHRYVINNIGFTVVRLRDVFDLCVDDIVNNDSRLLYDYNHIN